MCDDNSFHMDTQAAFHMRIKKHFNTGRFKKKKQQQKLKNNKCINKSIHEYE